ncbi:MAG TPA: hypothetical protein VFP37_07745 [Steroidobacteraceae bacterium]|nr:hypothetical protein [Steroidobacteraceae bacterium]
MLRKINRSARQCAYAAGAALLLGGTLASAADSVDSAMAGWLGREITIRSSSFADDFPVGGKITFVYDQTGNVVRACTRQTAEQDKPWRSDLAVPCDVTLTFTRGSRYCSLEDVKAGNAEVLATCHRMRSREIALQPNAKEAAELHDVLVFLVQSETDKPVIAILVDSPSRVTNGGIIVGGPS